MTQMKLFLKKNSNVGANVGVKLSNNQKITAKQLARKLNITQRTVERNIAILQEKGVIERIGSDKNGTWKINK